jgi:AraC-like DNA-binding protein
LPEPITDFETHVLRLTLLELAVRGGGTAHDRYHAAFPGDCRFDPTDLLDRHWRVSDSDPRTTLGQWIDDYVSSFELTHTVPLGAKALRALEAHSLARLDVKGLSSEVGCSPARLRREFHAWTGIALRPYHRTLRAEAAFEGVLASDLKIDALAVDLGYKSKKNMYRTLKTTFGLTPKQIRRLTPDQVSSALTSQRIGIGLRRGWRVEARSSGS